MDKRGVIERQMEQREGCEDFVELWILHAGETDQVSIISTRAPIVSCWLKADKIYTAEDRWLNMAVKWWVRTS